MGEVWEGQHDTTGIRVALKALLPDFAKTREVVLRFRREAELLSRVRSDRVARVIDFVTDKTYGPVLVTEFIEGRSLAEMMDAGPLKVEEALELCVDIARAVLELHRAHIVHRDLKPGNVILQPVAGGRTRAILVDLGVSRFISAACEGHDDDLTLLTKTQIVVGTVGYMAPEQILNAHDVTESADVYALGAMFFRMVAGRHAFGELSGVEMMRTKILTAAPPLKTGRTDRVAREFERIVSRALERDLAARYATVDAMLADLKPLQARGARSSAGALLASRVRPAARVSAACIALAAVVLVVASRAGTGPSGPRRTSGPEPTAAAAKADVAQTATMAATQEPPVCHVIDESETPVSQPPNTPPPPRPKTDARARDAQLLRAMRRAVSEEAYMTLPLARAPLITSAY